MHAFLNALRIAVSILPAVVDLVRAIERAVPQSGIGAEKLQLLKDLIVDVYRALDEETKKGISLEGAIALAAALANRFVALFNAIGWPAAVPAQTPSQPGR